MKQVFIVFEKSDGDENERDFLKTKMIKRNFRTGVFEDLKSYDQIKKLWNDNKYMEKNRMTFYD